MDSALALTIYTGVLFGATGVVLGLWQILSSPDQPNYPTSGSIKRILMFWFMAALFYRSIELLNGATLGLSDGSLVRVPSSMALSATMQFALFTAFLVDHCRNWLPERTQRRIQQLLAIARCRPSKELVQARTSSMMHSTGAPCASADVVMPALIELHAQGAHVSGPNEGPEAFTQR